MNILQQTARLIAGIGWLTLGGCISLGEATDPTRYFSLESRTAPGGVGHGIGVLVGPLELPEYLNRPQLVIRGQGSQLQLAPYDRWAEPLADSIVRRVAGELRVRLDRQEVIVFPSVGLQVSRWQVVGKLARFETNLAGDAELQVTWGIEDTDEQFAHGPVFGVYREDVPAGADSAARVEAMARLLDQFAGDIAAALQQLTPAARP